MAYATMAQLHLLGPTSVPAVEWGRKALDLLENLDDPEVLAYALNTVGAAELRTADDPFAWGRIERSLAIALERGLDEHDVQGLRPPEHGDGGNDLRQDPHPAQGLAGRGLVPDQPEAGRERLGAAAGARAGQLPDGLGDPASLAPGDGAT